MYLDKTVVLEAEEQLRLFEASSYPHMKDIDRRQAMRRYQSIIQPAEIITHLKDVNDAWQSLRDRKR